MSLADPSEMVTLTRCGELTTAQLLCGRLDAEGIEGFIPDERLAVQPWHLTRAPGGIRVQVRRAEMERAQKILALVDSGDKVDEPEAGRGNPDGVSQPDDDGSISIGDRAGYRAMRVALVSLWLMGLVHPYSLLLAVRALGRGDLSAWGRQRAWIALLVSLAGCAWVCFWAYRFGKLAR